MLLQLNVKAEGGLGVTRPAGQIEKLSVVIWDAQCTKCNSSALNDKKVRYI